MSHNPMRQKHTAKRQRRLDPRAGVKASDIRARYGPQAATVEDVRNKTNTPRGWRVMIHKGDAFEMVYEFICSRNATGIIVNHDHDRAVRVLGGEIYLTLEENIIPLRAGESYSLEAGLEYQLATSGSFDAEVMFCQGPDYEETLEQLSEPQALNASMNMPLPRETGPAQPRVDGSQAMLQAQIQQFHRQRRMADQNRSAGRPSSSADGATTAGDVRRTPPPSRAPLPGQQMIGTNPRPIGSGGFSE